MITIDFRVFSDILDRLCFFIQIELRKSNNLFGQSKTQDQVNKLKSNRIVSEVLFDLKITFKTPHTQSLSKWSNLFMYAKTALKQLPRRSWICFNLS